MSHPKRPIQSRLCTTAQLCRDLFGHALRMLSLASQLDGLRHALWILPLAALLGAAMGFIRPVRRGLVPRSSHVIQTQVLLAIVGAIIIVGVAESLAARFANVEAAGLVRDRRR